jgi:general secretion pathway protein G
MDRHPNRRARRAGFTLLEILIVVVIIGMLAAIVLPRVTGHTDMARATAARAEIQSFKVALESFKYHFKRYPTSAEGLEALVRRPDGVDHWPDGGFLDQEAEPVDPWGNPYVYVHPGQHGPYDIMSYGADGQPGGSGSDGDIVSWNLKARP